MRLDPASTDGFSLPICTLPRNSSTAHNALTIRGSAIFVFIILVAPVSSQHFAGLYIEHIEYFTHSTISLFAQ